MNFFFFFSSDHFVLSSPFQIKVSKPYVWKGPQNWQMFTTAVTWGWPISNTPKPICAHEVLNVLLMRHWMANGLGFQTWLNSILHKIQKFAIAGEAKRCKVPACLSFWISLTHNPPQFSHYKYSSFLLLSPRFEQWPSLSSCQQHSLNISDQGQLLSLAGVSMLS